MDLVYDDIKKGTESALLFVFGDREIWIARSLCVLKDVGIVRVARWFVVNEGLEEFAMLEEQ